MKNLKIILLRIWTVFWKSGLFFLFWGILLTPFILAFSDKLEGIGNIYGIPVKIYIELIAMLTILCSAWIMVSFFDQRPFVSIGFMRDHLIRDILLGIGIGAAWLLLSIVVSLILRSAVLHSTHSLVGLTLLFSGTAVLLNTVTQEVLSRSYIFQTIESQTNAVWAVILTSILFVLIHASALQSTWLPAVNIFFAGILFGVAYYVSKNLWLPISIHFIWNFLLGSVFGLAVSGRNLVDSWKFFSLKGPSLLTGGSFGLEGSIVVTAVTILFIAGLLMWYKFYNKSQIPTDK